MRKAIAAIFIAMFAVAFVLGCTGAKKETPGAGAGYTLAVSPQEVMTGGMSTMDLRLTNSFEKSMTDVMVTTPEISEPYAVSGYINTTGTNILPGQTYPVLMTLDVHDTAFGKLENKNIQVCFNYTTSYYYDVAKKSKSGTEEFSTGQGQTSGPITVTPSGLNMLYLENNKTTGSLTIANNWQGSIEKINKITATLPNGLSGIEMKIGSNCSGAQTAAASDATLQKDSIGCDILHNKGIIASGLTVVTALNETSDTAGVVRVQGTIDYNYCYKIPIPTITVKTVPQ
jgi:hypothetical protein